MEISAYFIHIYGIKKYTKVMNIKPSEKDMISNSEDVFALCGVFCCAITKKT